MSKVKSFDEYKLEMVGKTFGWLTVLEVFRDENNKRMCKCQCKCGNIVIKDMRKVYNNHTTSCGCYAHSKEKSDKLKQAWDNLEKRAIQSEKLVHYYNEHPETAEIISNKVSEFYKDNPEKAIERGKKYSTWANNNKDYLAAKGKKHSEFYKNNKNVAITQGKKISEFYKNNPDKLFYRTEKRKQTLKNNPSIQKIITAKNIAWSKSNHDKIKAIADKNSSYYKYLRTLVDYSQLIDYIYPDQISDLLNGNLTSKSLIKTKCPICGNYDEHLLHNIFLLKSNKLKNKLPLCSSCRNSLSTSSLENTIHDYISTIYNGECIKNTRDIITPLELDLYYPEKRIAIEVNGDYWHDENHKDKHYHFNKFKLCKEKGIRLISIFEHDWYNKNKLIKDLLHDIFGKTIIVYARKCVIKKLEYKEKSEFINKYHFDGDSNQGSIPYGLYYNNELVSVMSFGKLRGQNSLHDNINNYELVRFVSKSGYTVIGGFSKLFKYFINNHKPNYILCYSDNDLFLGDVYSKLGFKLKSLGDKSIDYIWTKNFDVLTRFQCMPSKLLNKYKQYKDIQINGSIENYIMHDLGYIKIYRCGNSIWEYYN